MPSTLRSTLLHMNTICPGKGFFKAKRRRVSFCQLTLHGARAVPLNTRPWLRRFSWLLLSVPITSTTYSCSSLA
ncbi:hypothetical protein FQZ97_1231290 [compost metagenome]